MKKILNLAILLALGVLVSACSTVINGSKQEMTIDSKPSAANISIKDNKGQSVGTYTTPATVTLERSDGFFKGKTYTVEVKKPGYKTTTFEISPRLSGWYIGGNFILGGLVGWLVVDPLTGAMYILEPKGEGVEGDDSQVVITLMGNLSEAQRTQLKPLK